VHAIDPFDAVGGTAAFNPLDLVDPRSADAVDDARLLADMLVVPDARSSGEQAFWNEEARGLLSGLILHVAASAPMELRTLAYVRELLTLRPERFSHLLEEMLESDAVGGLVSRAAARLLQKAEKERSGVVSTAQSHTHFLDSPRMARAMGASTFRLEELKRDRLSVYLVLPPERMDGYHRWLRLMIASSLLAMTRTPGEPAERVLFLLDEFAHLGRMQPVERDVGLVGGYGVRFWLLVQDLSQLRGTYPEKWQSFLANCDVLQTFGTNDWETAEYLSKMTGETTVLVESENRSAGVSRGRHGHRQEGAALTVAEKGRRLLLPDEILRLPVGEELLFVRGHSPVRARRLDYLVDAELAVLADANPMHVDTLALKRSGPRSVIVAGQ
jgi:type IV secretion system protein VirD4